MNFFIGLITIGLFIGIFLVSLNIYSLFNCDIFKNINKIPMRPIKTSERYIEFNAWVKSFEEVNPLQNVAHSAKMYPPTPLMFKVKGNVLIMT